MYVLLENFVNCKQVYVLLEYNSKQVCVLLDYFVNCKQVYVLLEYFVNCKSVCSIKVFCQYGYSSNSTIN